MDTTRPANPSTSSEVRAVPKKHVHTFDETEDEEQSFQDADEWMGRHDALLGGKVPENLPPSKKAKIPPLQQPKLKAKKEIDPDVVIAEKEALKDVGSENWVGKLLIYRQAKPIAGGGLTWDEGSVSEPIPRFTCAVVIHESAIKFGHETIGFSTRLVSFTNKKSAKQHAAKKAIDWLIENGKMRSDGSITFPKVPMAPPQNTVKSPIKKSPLPQPNPQPQLQKNHSSSSNESTPSVLTKPTRAPSSPPYTQLIPKLCHKLGINVPTYKFSAVQPDSPLWDAYADFQGDPRIEGPVGVVKNVFGKKNAKEEVAKEVWSFLKSIERHRLEECGVSEEEEEEEGDEE